MVREHGGDGEIVVPPTIHALLQARIDSLDGDVRVVMERGSVEGEVFHRGSVAVLSPDPVRDGGRVPPGDARPQGAHPLDLADLPRRRGLPLPPPAHPRRRLRVAAEGDARGAARAVRRLARAATTSSSATRSSATTSSRRTATAPSSIRWTTRSQSSARRAADRLGTAGAGAMDRGDWGAARGLLRRARGLLPEGSDERAALGPDLALTLAGGRRDRRGHGGGGGGGERSATPSSARVARSRGRTRGTSSTTTPRARFGPRPTRLGALLGDGRRRSRAGAVLACSRFRVLGSPPGGRSARGLGARAGVRRSGGREAVRSRAREHDHQRRGARPYAALGGTSVGREGATNAPHPARSPKRPRFAQSGSSVPGRGRSTRGGRSARVLARRSARRACTSLLPGGAMGAAEIEWRAGDYDEQERILRDRGRDPRGPR